MRCSSLTYCTQLNWPTQYNGKPTEKIKTSWVVTHVTVMRYMLFQSNHVGCNFKFHAVMYCDWSTQLYQTNSDNCDWVFNELCVGCSTRKSDLF